MNRPLRLIPLAALLAFQAWAEAAPPGAVINVTPRAKQSLGSATLRSLVADPGTMRRVIEATLRPDLTISAATWSQDTYLPPAKLGVTFTVTNTGLGASGPFHVHCFVPGLLLPQVAFVQGGLKSKQSTTCTFSAQLDAGPTPATAYVDYYNEVPESDEANNMKVTEPKLAVGAKDFHVDDLWLEYDKSGPIGAWLPSGPVLQPLGDLPVVVRARLGYSNKADNQPLEVPVNVCLDGKIYKTLHLTIGANGMMEAAHVVVLPAGAHEVNVSAASALVDDTPASNKLTKTYTWRSIPKAPFRHTYYAINDYASLGIGPNLKQSINEGRRFCNRMLDCGHPHIYHAENGDVNWDDWTGGPGARANWGDIAYFVGHGSVDGPAYGKRGYQGDTLKMQPSEYRLGRDGSGNTQLRWAVWSACQTLFDGTTDQSTINWDGDNGLSRWFVAFQGLHSIMGMRSLGWQGSWDGGWFGDSGDSRQRASDFVNQVSAGTNFSWAWFLANRWCVYDQLEKGFESATLFAVSENTDYTSELFTAPYPDYVGTPVGFYYDAWRIGNPTW